MPWWHPSRTSSCSLGSPSSVTTGSASGSTTIDHDELRELVVDAWRMCVPKKVAASYDG